MDLRSVLEGPLAVLRHAGVMSHKSWSIQYARRKSFALGGQASCIRNSNARHEFNAHSRFGSGSLHIRVGHGFRYIVHHKFSAFVNDGEPVLY